MTKVLEGLTSQVGLKTLVIQNNEVSLECVPHIQNLLQRARPLNLDELHLYFCRINWQVTQQLLELLKEKTLLKRLSLVKANLNGITMQTIAEILGKARSLTDLDISWNEIKAKDMIELVEMIGLNRKLVNLNLGWNGLVRVSAPENEKDIYLKEQEEVLLKLSTFIKHNKNL